VFVLLVLMLCKIHCISVVNNEKLLPDKAKKYDRPNEKLTLLFLFEMVFQYFIA